MDKERAQKHTHTYRRGDIDPGPVSGKKKARHIWLIARNFIFGRMIKDGNDKSVCIDTNAYHLLSRSGGTGRALSVFGYLRTGDGSRKRLVLSRMQLQMTDLLVKNVNRIQYYEIRILYWWQIQNLQTFRYISFYWINMVQVFF